MDIKKILKQLTLQDKLGLICGKDNWGNSGVERLNIPPFLFVDGPQGVRKMVNEKPDEYKTAPATCFPTPSAMACTWNIKLAEEVAEAMGKETKINKRQALNAPGINIKRIPICGRNFEYFSEDPVVSGEFGAAYIKGLQKQNISPTLKHFALNNQECNRHFVSAEVDKRTLREIYLDGFERAVKKGKPYCVMCSYNKINGEYTSESKYLLTDVLRNEWGFDGAVVSDWGAVRNHVKSLKAGIDIAMPHMQNDIENLEKAYNEGKISDFDIDKAVERILKLIDRTCSEEKNDNFNRADNNEIALKAAEESMVLLKNENVLPLKKEGKIVVIGYQAENPVIQGDGSSFVNDASTSPLKEFKDICNNNVEFIYPGANFTLPCVNTINIIGTKLYSLCSKADAVIIFAGNEFGVESEAFDRNDINLPSYMNEIIRFASGINKNTVVVLNTGAPVAMPWKNNAPAILQTNFSGRGLGKALARIIFGEVNPSGKLAESYPNNLEEIPAMKTYPGENLIVPYKEGLMVGYRFYDKFNIEPLFPFGHGLSYTKFVYSNLKIENNLNKDGTVSISLNVKNAGAYDGKETVQIYLSQLNPIVTRPLKELKAFDKKMIKSGECVDFEFILSKDDFTFYDDLNCRWKEAYGEYECLAAASSKEIKLKEKIKYEEIN